MNHALVLVALLAACAPEAPEDFSPADPPADDPPEDPADDDDAPVDPTQAVELSSGAACPAGHAGLGVRVLDRLIGESECPDQLECVAPYERFAALPEVQAAARPYDDCEAELDGWYDDRAAGEPIRWSPLPPDPGHALGEQILGRSNLAFLFDDEGFWARPMDVVIGQETIRTSGTGASYRQREVWFTDPLVGDVRALHLLPMDGDASVPTVIVLPGHAEGPEQHRDRRFAQYLPENGLAALIINFRAWYMPYDHEATVQLVCQRQSMMMVRGYEAMLGFKYLEAVEEGCGARVGMLGHSGGSLTANLLAWLDVNPTDALVSDLTSGYMGVDEFQGGFSIDCETHEQLAGLAEEINDLDAAPRPVQQVPYGYPTENTLEWGEPDPDDLLALDHFVPFFREQLIEP